MEGGKAFNAMTSYNPKTSYYQPNGSARDSYIYFNNGGLCSPKSNKTAYNLGRYLYSVSS